MKKILAALLALVMVFGLLPAMNLGQTNVAEAAAAPAAGEYVLAANVNGAYFAIPTNPTLASSKIAGQSINVGADGKVAAADAEGYTWTLSTNAGGGYDIFDGNKYLLHGTDGASGTNLKLATAATLGWTFESIVEGENGPYRVFPVGKTRGLAFRAGTYNQFGGYAMSNVTTTSKEYHGILLLEVASGEDVPTCEHTNTTVETVEATCVDAGSVTTTCNDCGNVVSVETIEATGHSFVDDVCTACGEKLYSYQLVTNVADLVVGESVVIVALESDYALSTTQNGNNRGQASVTKSEDASTVMFGDDVQRLTLENGTTEGTYAFYTGAGYLYAAATGSNYLRTEETLSANSSWKIEIAADTGSATVTAQGANENNWLLHNSSSKIFSCYASTSTQKAIAIYKLASDCDHANTVDKDAVAATCTTAGYTEGTQCMDCGLWISGHEIIDALGHSWDEGNVEVEATCTQAGSKTVTCIVCGATETQEIAMIAHNYLDGACTVCGAADPATLPGLSGRYYIAGRRSDTTNYYYITNDLGTASTKRYQIEDSGLLELPAEITAGEANKIFVIEKNEDGTYCIYSEGIEGEAKYFGYTSGNSGTFVAADAALALTIDQLEGGIYNIHFAAADEERYLSINGTTGNDYAAWYKNTQKYNLSLIPVTDGTVTPDCEHTNTTTVSATEATCETAGYTEGVQCADCGAWISGHEEIPATGHAWDEGVETTAATCTAEGVMTYTCATCGETKTEAIAKIAHEYVDGACTVCGAADPATQPGLSGRYYIAGRRSDTTNYYYITNDLGTASTKRYQIVDSGLMELPAEITAGEADKIFVIEKNEDGAYRIYSEGIEGEAKYFGYTSGNSGTFVAADAALALTIDQLEGGIYNIHFAAADEERYLSINATTGNDYAAWYKNTQKYNLSLIPVAEGTTPPVCTHENVTTTTEEPTCTAEGKTTVVCDDCGQIISEEPISPLGHTEVTTTTDATCETAGSTVVTCSVCGETLSSTVIPATGHSYTYTSNEDGTHDAVCNHDASHTVTGEACDLTNGACPLCGYKESTVAVKLGDVDCDGDVDGTDVSLLKKYLLNQGTITEQGQLNADVNGDGIINGLDASSLSKYLLGGSF